MMIVVLGVGVLEIGMMLLQGGSDITVGAGWFMKLPVSRIFSPMGLKLYGGRSSCGVTD